ncbi:MAG TPA: 4'-phosphopantetheinyl transferase superfamily protein [Polyangiaceae bacterium]
MQQPCSVAPKLALTPDVIHVYDFKLTEDAKFVERALETLDDEEQTQAARYATVALKRRHVVSHGRLRETLGQHLGLAPSDVHYTKGELGKPALHPNHCSSLMFNLSHSGERCVIAVTREKEVGIDVEYRRALPDWKAIASRFFSEREYAALSQLPESVRARAFFTIWTRKEAYIKALGLGLSLDLSTFAVEVDPRKPAQLLWARDEAQGKGHVWLGDFDVGDDYCATVAGRGDHFDLVLCSPA